MLHCIQAKLCENNQLLAEKLEQACELVEQTESVCEKLDAILDPDGECPPCPVTSHSFQFWAFDEANGIFDADYVHTSTVNGTALSNPFNAAWTNKSEAYQTTTDAVNALPGVTMTLVNDFGLTQNGKPEYKITYPVGQTVTIVNTHTGDVYTFSSDGEECVGTVVDNGGSPISSYTPVEL